MLEMDWDEQEKLRDSLNAAFDHRIKEHIDAAVERHLPMVDTLIKNRINGNYTPELNQAFRERIEEIAKNAADNHIRLQSGALTELVQKVFDDKAEKYIEGEVQRRLNALKRRMMAAVEPQQLS